MLSQIKLIRPVTSPEQRKRNAENTRKMLASFDEAQKRIDAYYESIGKKAPVMIAG